MTRCILNPQTPQPSGIAVHFMKPTGAVAGALVPAAVFILSLSLSGASGPATGTGGWFAGAALIVATIVVPCAFALSSAWVDVLRFVILVALTTVAFFAARLIAGSDDAQAGLAILLVPYVAVPTGIVLSLIRAAQRSQEMAPRIPLTPGHPAARLGGFIVDGTTIGILLGALSELPIDGSRALLMSLAFTGITAYVGLTTARFGRTPGQFLFRIHVVRCGSSDPPALSWAMGRGAIIATEVLAFISPISLVILATDFLLVIATGRSVADFMTRTEVISLRENDEAPEANPVAHEPSSATEIFD